MNLYSKDWATKSVSSMPDRASSDLKLISTIDGSRFGNLYTVKGFYAALQKPETVIKPLSVKDIRDNQKVNACEQRALHTISWFGCSGCLRCHDDKQSHL